MRIVTTSLLVATLALMACNSRVNPGNWGKSGQPLVVDQTEPEEINPLVPENPRTNILSSLTNPEEEYLGVPVDQISSVIVESMPGGAIIRVTGISDVQGLYDVRLTPANDDEEPVDGVLTYTLEGVYVEEAVRGGPEQLRTVVAGVRVTDNQLAEAKVIRVEGRLNTQSTSRR